MATRPLVLQGRRGLQVREGGDAWQFFHRTARGASCASVRPEAHGCCRPAAACCDARLTFVVTGGGRCGAGPCAAGKDGRPGPRGPQGPRGKDGEPWKDLVPEPSAVPESAGDGDAKVEDKTTGDGGAEVEAKKSGKGKKKGKKMTRSHAVLARLRKQHERVVAQRIRHRQRQLQADMSHAVAVRSKFAKTVSARAAWRGVFVPREERRRCLSARAQPDVHVVFVPYP